MQFDHEQMRELASLKAYRYARDSACEDYRVDIRLAALDRDADGNIPL